MAIPLAVGGTVALGGAGLVPDGAGTATGPLAKPPLRSMDVTLIINGAQHRLAALDVNTTLLDVLRDHLQLTGSKKGCGLGHCGACTVLS